MTVNLFGNPHSASASSQLSMQRIESVRLRVLQFFGADPNEFDVVFVANATAGIKLVAEAMRCAPGEFDFAYHQASHTSLVGVREEARNSFCLDDGQVQAWLEASGALPDAAQRASDTLLFAYPAQSNMDGRKYPLTWPLDLRRRTSGSCRHMYSLLDAAAYAASSPLDLGRADTAPDFTVVSFYKIFGFPDLGALIVRRQAEEAFDHRRYFGGGTVDMVVCVQEQWHVPKRQFLHERLEDGTLPVHSIIALDAALDTHKRLFGTMAQVRSHTSFLWHRLYRGLESLTHFDGSAVCVLYTPKPAAGPQGNGNSVNCGPVVTFNIRNHLGAWVGLAEFEKLSSLKKIHIRTGGVCNPGGVAAALSLQPWEMKQNFSAGFRCGTENDIMGGKPTGVIRASLGAMSTMADVDGLIGFVDEFYRDVVPVQTAEQLGICRKQANLYVSGITVYPIKSCAGFEVPEGVRWEVRPEGLAWDREWCLVHRGSGHALSQKQHPRMALILPVLDFGRGELRVSVEVGLPESRAKVSVPLSNNPSHFCRPRSAKPIVPRVCGEEIAPQTYASPEINDFFSQVLGVPCQLVRFTPGGQGKKTMRYAKAHLQKHQVVYKSPEASSDQEAPKRRILLSNESPVLAISAASLGALNCRIRERGGQAVSATAFRANILIAPSGSGGAEQAEQQAYAEDDWSVVRIGKQRFKTLGACRRCHMVCIDQTTAERSDEPFVTLAKTRRLDGKVYFGIHMAHESLSLPAEDGSVDAQFPTIRVGDVVQPA